MTDRHRSVSAEEWSALSPLLDRLLDAPIGERETLLDALSSGDTARRSMLARMLIAADRPMPLLEGTALDRFNHLASSDPTEELPTVLGGRYRLERELGRGGMARVHLAFDLKHDRQVAIKVILRDLAATLGRERFLREIGIAARLRHPNIMPLFDSGDVNGLLYFVMPYEAGQSLRDRIEREGQLAMPDAISILRDVARALTYAHGCGVVHRDIKPDNVLLSGDAAVVTDFGIAKAFELARTETNTGDITQAGMVIGTPAYMAPEQGLGDPTADHRADIYSFGCLAYELFTGRPPFAETSTLKIVAAQLAGPPESVANRRPDLPPSITRLIERCLEEDPAKRPQESSELLDVLGGLGMAALPRRRRRWLVSAGVVLVVIAIAAAVRWQEQPRGGPVTVAVLPLLSRGGDSAQALVAEGFGEDLSAALGKVPWLRVVSRAGAFNYKGLGDIDPKAVGRALGTRYLVMGSLRSIEGRQSLLIQLINTEDDFQLWSDQFERPQDLASLRNQIVVTIADSLRKPAGSAAGTRVALALRSHRGSAQAYNLYLIGKQKLRQRSQNIAGSIAMFRAAVALDTLAADAHSGLSLALALSPYFQGVRPDSVADEAMASARRAIALDSTLAEPHTALGLVYSHRFDWQRAQDEFERAVSLDSHDVEARLQYGRLLIDQGHNAAALAQFKAAQGDDPASAVVASHLSHVWLLLHQPDSASYEAMRALQIDSLNLTTLVMSAKVLIARGRFAEARAVINRGPPYWPEVLWTVAASGDRETSRHRIADLAAEHPIRWMGHTAMAFGYLGLGETTPALDELERATAAGEIWPQLESTFDPVFDPVRRNPRFNGLLTRAGLAPR